MDPVLQNLIRYQELSLQLFRINAHLEEFPRQIAAIDAEMAAASTSLEAARASVSDHQKERRRLEMQLQDLEVKLKKYNDQLMQVKTNEEYKAMQHEIGGVKDKIGAIEEEILQLMEYAEEGDRRVAEEGRLMEARRLEAEERRVVVRGKQAVVQEEAAGLSRELEAARTVLGPEALDMFNRIAQNRNGIALARARDERCQECKVRIRPQIYQDLKRNDRLIPCDSCKRILYYVAEAPAADAPA